MSVMTPPSLPELSEPPQQYAEQYPQQPQQQYPQQYPQQRAPLTPERLRHRRLVVGTILVLVGVAMLIETLTTWSLGGSLVMPALGLVFAVWGCVWRRAGLIIPGGILLGAGSGPLLVQMLTPSRDITQGGIVVLCLALGFAIIAPLTKAFTERMHWWALIPASVLAFVGISLLGGEWGVQALIWLGRLWPIALIVVGAILLWNGTRRHV